MSMQGAYGREGSSHLSFLLWGGKLAVTGRQTPFSNPISGLVTEEVIYLQGSIFSALSEGTHHQVR